MTSVFIESDLPKSVYLAEVCSDRVRVGCDKRGDIWAELKDDEVLSLTEAFKGRHLTHFGQSVTSLFKDSVIVDLGSGSIHKSAIVPVLAAAAGSERYVGVDMVASSDKGVLLAEDENIKGVIAGESILGDFYKQDILEFAASNMFAYDGNLVVAMIGLETLVHQQDELLGFVDAETKQLTDRYVVELLGHIKKAIGNKGRLLKGTATLGINFERHGFQIERTAKNGHAIYKVK